MAETAARAPPEPFNPVGFAAYCRSASAEGSASGEGSACGFPSQDTQSEALWPCVKGCGLLAATGKDRKGRAFTTCCRGCALGGGHDATCAGILCTAIEDPTTPPGPTIASPPRPVAAMTMAPPPPPVQPTAGRPGRSRSRERFRRWVSVPNLWDPIWGEVELKRMRPEDRGSLKRRCGVHCFAFCPCLVVSMGCLDGEVWTGLSKAEVRLAWRRLLLSWSMLFSVLQILLLLAPLAFDGYVEFKMNPMLGPSIFTLDKMGAKNTAKIVYENEWWRLGMPMLLHAGWIHLLGNLSLQLRTGLVLESLWGHTPWLFIYLLSGIFGSMMSSIFQEAALSVGASGSLCGLLGAWGPFIIITWNQTLPKDRKARNSQLFMALTTAVVMIPLSFLPMVDWSAHLGGLAMGAACAMVVFGKRLQSRLWSLGTRIAGALGVVVLFALATWQLLQLEPPEFLLHL